MGDGSGMSASGNSTINRTISRRTVTRGVAWSAPLLAVGVAAPAYASSIPCVVQTNFDNLTPGTQVGVMKFLPSTITAQIAFANGSDSTLGDTGEVARTNTTPAWNYIEVEMLSRPAEGDYVDVTINLSAPVTNLGFRIHDIDKTSDGWDDTVWVQTPGFTYARGTNVVGVGTDTNPFRNNVVGDQAIDSGLNHVDLKWAGPVQQIKFRYRAGMNGDSGNQHIGIGNISFSDCVANPKGFAAPSDRAQFAGGGFVPGKSGALVEGRDN